MPDNPAAIIAKGEKALNFLVGQVLKREPRANPHVVRALILERLDIVSTS